MWGYIAVLVIAVVAAIALRPKPQNAKPASIDDIDVPTAEEGREIPVVFGSRELKSTNCAWYGDFKSKAIKEGGGLFSSSQTVGYKYYLGMHSVLCHGPIDGIMRIDVGSKVAYKPFVFNPIPLSIDKPNLFGGKKREGGIGGTIDLMFGETDQVRNIYLQSQLGDEIPAYRGVASVVYNQFYMGNSPYLKTWNFKVQRIYNAQNGVEQWYAEKAGIGSISGENIALYFGLDYSNSMLDPIEFLGQSKISQLREALETALTFVKQLIAGGSIQNISISAKLFEDVGSITRNNCSVSDVQDIIDFFNNTSTQLSVTSFANALENAPSFFAANPGYTPIMILVSDAVDGSGQADIDQAIEYRDQTVNNLTYGIQLGETFNPADLQQISKDATVPVITSSNSGYIAGLITQFISGHLDMNPAHIIRECLINNDWGMGYLEADINDTSFVESADLFFDEGLGMSLLWTSQVSINEFVSEVLRHVDAILRVNIETGLFELIPVRGGYDEGLLLHLDESSISKIDGLKQTQFGELTSSITVNYWNHEANATGSVTVQDTALSQTQRDPINTTQTYDGFTNFKNASYAAARDLKALSVPLWAGTIFADLTADGLQVGDVFLLSWPVANIQSLPVRVSNVDYGDGVSNRIKIKFTQDVFSTPLQQLMTKPSDGWTPPDTTALAVDARRIEESSYRELVFQLGQASANSVLSNSNDFGSLSMSAAKPSETAIESISLYDKGFGNIEGPIVDFSPSATLAEDVARNQTVVAIENAEDLEDIVIGSFATINGEFVRIDAISSSEMTIGRGLFDTPPIEHLSGDFVLFEQNLTEYVDDSFSDSDSVDVTLLTNTSSETLDEAFANIDTVVFASRAMRPYPPGNLQVNGVSFPESTDGQTSVTLTWSHRNRLEQTSDTFLDYFDSLLTSEPNVTYEIDFYNELDELVTEVVGLTTLTYEWTTEATDSGIIPDYQLFSWNLSVAAPIGNSLDMGTMGEPYNPANIQGLFISPDGSNLYVLGFLSSSTSVCLQYSLSTAWDISTASYTTFLLTSSQLAGGNGIFLSPDGTRFFGISSASNNIRSWTLSTPWDISTATYDNLERGVNDSSPQTPVFSPDGTTLIISGYADDKIMQYTLSTPWDVTTASYNGDMAASNPTGLTISTDGQTLWYLNYANANVTEWALSTPWDIATRAITGVVYDIGANSTVQAIYANDGKTVIIESGNNGLITDHIAYSEIGAGGEGRLNGKYRLVMKSTRDGYDSFKNLDLTIKREGYGFNYGEFYGGV